MIILGTICTRKGSKGIPHKNTKLLGGKPLVSYTIECAMISRAFTNLIVSTDDPDVVAIATEYELNILPRPPELATDTASKWDVFRHIVGAIDCDILVDLDTGCPFREPEDIGDALRILRTDQVYDVDCVMTAYKAERNPYFNMVQNWGKIARLVCEPLDTHFTCRQDAPPVWSLSPSVFAVRRATLDKYSHWSQSNMQINIIPRTRALDIDTPDDFEYAEWLVSKHD